MGQASSCQGAQRLERVRSNVSNKLLPWFSRHQRVMPWRSNRTAYRVWISELMLQQTRVDTVRPYFRRWMRRFPSLRVLSKASLQDVLKQWEGLGYYARARNAHKTANLLVNECHGRFPKQSEELRRLPGIGPYTAAAIASLVFGEAIAVVDGNVTRVLSRLFAFDQEIQRSSARQQIQTWADQLLIADKAGMFNEAMMELGATVCLPRDPACRKCPLRTCCQAHILHLQESFPNKRPARPVPHRHVGAGIIVDDYNRILIARRKKDAMLGGLWEFPGGQQNPGESLQRCVAREVKEELDLLVRIGPSFHTVRHAFSHFTMDLHVYWVRIDAGRPKPLGCDEVAWVTRKQLRNYPLPRADQRVLDRLERVTRFPRF